MEDKWVYDQNDKQMLASMSDSLYTLFGGSRGGGKTTWLCCEVLKACWEQPGMRAFIGRKVFAHFMGTTFQTLMQWCRWETVKRHDKQNKEILFTNGSKLLYGGFDDREHIEKLKGAEFGIFAVDQVEELHQTDFDLIYPVMRFTLPGGIRPKYKVLFTANPAQNWVKSKFIDNPESDYKYVPSTCKDNAKNLPDDYEENMRKLYKSRPEMIEAYINGNWDSMSQDNVVIKFPWIMGAASKENRRPYTGPTKRVISCDPARYGSDMTVVYALRNYEVIGEDSWVQTDTMTTAGKLIMLKELYKANTIAVDEIGIGAGIVDRLKEMGQPVMAITSSNKSERPERYLNLRAQMWFDAAEKFQQSLPMIPSDPDLQTELNTVQYQIRDSRGLTKIEDKDDVRKRLGRSPDKADALIMGLYAVDHAQPYEMSDRGHISKGWNIKAEQQTANMLAGSNNGGW